MLFPLTILRWNCHPALGTHSISKETSCSWEYDAACIFTYYCSSLSLSPLPSHLHNLFDIHVPKHTTNLLTSLTWYGEAHIKPYYDLIFIYIYASENLITHIWMKWWTRWLNNAFSDLQFIQYYTQKYIREDISFPWCWI